MEETFTLAEKEKKNKKNQKRPLRLRFGKARSHTACRVLCSQKSSVTHTQPRADRAVLPLPRTPAAPADPAPLPSGAAPRAREGFVLWERESAKLPPTDKQNKNCSDEAQRHTPGREEEEEEACFPLTYCLG